MKRVFAGAALLFLAACSDTPTQLTQVAQPQFSTVIGDNATWYFEGPVIYTNSPWAVVGDVVKGTVHFEITGDDTWPDPCSAYRPAKVDFDFTVNGTPYYIPGPGMTVAAKDCDSLEYPWLQINTYPTGGPITGWLNLYYPADSEDFPLVPPALSDVGSVGYRGFQMYTYTDNTGFFVRLDVLRLANPTAKAQCLKDGWQTFNFKNQGQCVRFIETGKDSR